MGSANFKMALLLACGFSLLAFPEPNLNQNHQQKKSGSGRKILDRSSSSIEKKKPMTEPPRELPLEKAPILTCKSKSGKFNVVFNRESGYEKASLVENGKEIGVLPCRPKATDNSEIQSLECATTGENGFAVTFQYPTATVMRLGELFEVNLGSRSSRGQVVCPN